MAKQEPQPSLPDLDARLKKARAAQRGLGGMDGRAKPRSVGFALQAGIELVGTLAVAVVIGYLLDAWLGTQPWLLVVFFFLGAGAGGLNVYRLSQKIEAAQAEAEAPDQTSERGPKA
ncbi:MAG: AtpZ/AtpI family protein [Alphaproteobacteria bacterium]